MIISKNILSTVSPFAMGTSQPATEVMVETFRGTEYDTGFDQNLLAEIAIHFFCTSGSNGFTVCPNSPERSFFDSFVTIL